MTGELDNCTGNARMHLCIKWAKGTENVFAENPADLHIYACFQPVLEMRFFAGFRLLAPCGALHAILLHFKHIIIWVHVLGIYGILFYFKNGFVFWISVAVVHSSASCSCGVFLTLSPKTP
ncbi:hypothetical protein CEXT_739771 [Caerostris extrusa]|uniref:Uncharacterized protein n=1 Tax=Caerostris extrusa TaxID=172846 RepID=A0AAV4U901_CAEEX|nr:hypothetical protein CEXT_739771 [Caerostris extrusa]